MTDVRLRQALLVAIVILGLDQATKEIVRRSMQLYESIPIFPGFSLTYVRNPGAAFSMVSHTSSASRRSRISRQPS